MNELVEMIKSLPNLLSLKPATADQIKDAEAQLGVNFAGDYKEYLANFGAVIADGMELSGIAKSEHRNVVSLTKRARGLTPKIAPAMYVIEDLCIDGIIIWQDSDGLIFQTSPNTEPKQIATSLADYIRNHAK